MKPNEKHRSIPTVDESLRNIGVASARGSVWAVSAEGADFVLRIAAIAVLARLLLPEHFGLISMVTAVTAVAERFKDAGLSIATVQFREITHEQITALFWINVLVGFLIAGGVVALSFPIAIFYKDDRLLQITWAIAASFVFGGMTVQHYALLRRTMQFRSIALIQVGSSVGSIVLAVVVAVLGGEYWALVVREVSRSAFQMIGAWVCMSWRPEMPRRGANVRRMLRFGGGMTLTNIVYYMTYSLDQIVVGRLFGAQALGLYRQGYNLVTAPAVQLGYPATLVGEPALARLRNRPESYRLYLGKLLAVLSFVSMPALFFVVVYADSLVMVALGSGWEEAADIFRILGLAFFMQPAMTMVGCVMISCGLARRTLGLACLSAVTLLVMFAVFSDRGPEGIAMAHAATFFLLLGPKLFLALRGTPATPGLVVSAVWRPVVCTLLTGAVMATVRQETQLGSAVTELAVGVGGGALVYLGLWLIVPGGYSQLRGMAVDLKSLLGAPKMSMGRYSHQIDDLA